MHRTRNADDAGAAPAGGSIFSNGDHIVKAASGSVKAVAWVRIPLVSPFSNRAHAEADEADGCNPFLTRCKSGVRVHFCSLRAKPLLNSTGTASPGFPRDPLTHSIFQDLSGHEIAVECGPTGRWGLHITVAPAGIGIACGHCEAFFSESPANAMQPLVQPDFTDNRNIPCR